MERKKLLKKYAVYFGLVFLLIFVVLSYCYVNQKYNFGIECMIHKWFGIYCPGCGLTRAFEAMLNLDFYQAFRYNALSLFLIPLLCIVCFGALYELVFEKESVLAKIPTTAWVVLAFFMVLYGIVRNFVPYLQPNVV